ncbi:protein Abitram-like [Onthophagus taurus]|uniref:protein Abitram-like n=1 Tax=Onthophagus taurus TaxID=166361 RepID=UPI0039BDD747
MDLNNTIDIPNILCSIDKSLLINNILISPSIKYYEHKYCKKISSVDERIYQRVSFHTNRICLLSLADDHPILKDNKKIEKINFEVSNVNRLDNVVLGKGKKGGQKLQPHNALCYIKCNDGETYTIYSCVEGKLIEVNKQLISNPELIKFYPVSNGYIALILPVFGKYDSFKDVMLTSNEYFE